MANAEKTPPTKAAWKAGRQASGVGGSRASSKAAWRGAATRGSGATKRIWGARQLEQNGVPSATAMPQLGQGWSTPAKLQERESPEQETVGQMVLSLSPRVRT